MDIFSVIAFLGGIALFLFGMSVMSKALEKTAGGKLDVMISKMTENQGKSFALGAVVTAFIQSSSAITVMLMGLVNSGIMRLSQTATIIMGANVGTTSTAWIMSIMGVESENVFLKMLKPESFSPILAFIGVIMLMMSKSERRRNIGEILVGFAVLMYGMKYMSTAVAPLADSPKFAELLTAFTNPFLGVIAGMLLTAAIQSSSASVCILQTLSLTGEITNGIAIPIVMGQNIGTCITAVISSVGVNRNAKRVAVLHAAFNVIGSIIFMAIYCVIYYGVGAAYIDKATGPVGIAVMHTVFNLVTSVILMPMQKQLVALSKKIIPSGKYGKEEVLLDDRLLLTPSLALQECKRRSVEMAQLTKKSVETSMELLVTFDRDKMQKVIDVEDEVDKYEDLLGSYLIKLSACNITDNSRAQVSKLLHSIGDLERISDHAVNICQSAEEISDKSCVFSEAGNRELSTLTDAVCELIKITEESFATDNVDMAYRVEPLEEVIDGLIETVTINHVNRLQDGTCTIEHGFIMGDLLNDYERVADHCSNIALGIIELSKPSFEPHAYINKLMAKDDPVFRNHFSEYRQKYSVKDGRVH